MKLRAYIYHKPAEKYSDCQDCFGVDSQNNRIAVSDGITQSIFPQWWADLLVQEYLKLGQFPTDISDVQAQWRSKVDEVISRRKREGQNPWRLEDCIAERQGAGATLCGLNWTKDQWHCDCLGDSALIVVSEDYSIRIITSQDGPFDNHPDYLDSFSSGRGIPHSESGELKGCKALLLVTDPFSEFFQKNELNPDFIKARIDELLSLNNHDDYVKLVDNWRSQYGMHNDDSTIVALNDLANPTLEIVCQDDWAKLCEEEETTEKAKAAPKEKETKEPEITVAPQEPESIADIKELLNQLVKLFKRSYNGKGEPKRKEFTNWLYEQFHPILKYIFKK